MSKTTPSAHELAQAEKKASKKLDLGNVRWFLLAAIVLWGIFLIAPYAGDVRGWQLTFFTDAASEAGMKITEYIYSTLLLLGIGIFTTLTVTTRITPFGWAAWMFSTVGFAYSIFATWLRQTRNSQMDGVDFHIGFYISILAAAIATISFAFVVFRRDLQQEQLARARAEHENLDEVGRAQRDLLVSSKRDETSNPLLIDDRRQRAAERHRRSAQDPKEN